LNSKATISLVIGLALSAAALYLAFRNVPFPELLDYLGSIDYFWVLPSVVLAMTSFVLRALRWRVILNTSRRIGFAAAFHPLMIGFMLNCILPGRLGELARPVILKQREDFPIMSGLATIAAERMFDIVLLVLLFAGVLAFVPIDPDFEMTFGRYRLDSGTLRGVMQGMLQLMLALVVALFLVSLDATRRLITRAIRAVPPLLVFLPPGARRWIADRPAAAAVAVVDNVGAGLEVIKIPRAMAACLVYSVFIWGLQAMAFWAISLGCPGVDINLAQALAVLVIICFFIALPSAPGFWGLWEAGGVFALALFGVPAREAAGFTLANHAIQMFPVIIVGLVSAFATGINIWQVSAVGGKKKVEVRG
jgi:uncharacterized membrane protein YbhN (UPF0104 family)